MPRASGNPHPAPTRAPSCGPAGASSQPSPGTQCVCLPAVPALRWNLNLLRRVSCRSHPWLCAFPPRSSSTRYLIWKSPSSPSSLPPSFSLSTPSLRTPPLGCFNSLSVGLPGTAFVFLIAPPSPRCMKFLNLSRLLLKVLFRSQTSLVVPWLRLQASNAKGSNP